MKWLPKWRMIRRCTNGGVPSSSSSDVRNAFLDYFVQQKNHALVRSSSVLPPHQDSSLLFTNSGMIQFKPIFLGSDDGRLKMAANSQKCIRVGGKHNDLEDVGVDGHHHTFFEMLGTWSFGSYFKEEACRMSWDLLTGPYRIPPAALYVTYFGGDPAQGLEADDECRDIWLRIGVPPKRVLPFGCKDNFWEMGHSGPCGPCTEIHFSGLSDDDGGAAAASFVNSGRPEVIELWNIVFIQYDRQADGALRKLRKSHVDTGMGLERLCALLGGSLSSYDSDLFRPLFGAIERECGCRGYGGRFDDPHDAAYRTVADHARMCAVSVADGVAPDEIGAGHCLRKVIRRAVTASHATLGAPVGLLARLLPHVAATSVGDAFPEVRDSVARAVDVVREEEERFRSLLDNGLRLFDRMCAQEQSRGRFSAENAWELFFVHGVPEDTIAALCASRGLVPEMEPFRARLNDERNKSTAARQQRIGREQYERAHGNNDFLPQEAAEILERKQVQKTDDRFVRHVAFSSDGVAVAPGLEARVVAIWDGSDFVDHFLSDAAAVVLDQTSFYAEAGGQACDVGHFRQTGSSDDAVFRVDRVADVRGYVVHWGRRLSGSPLAVGDAVVLDVDGARRAGCARNHTSAHLLHAALAEVLGAAATRQLSSAVAHDYFRFDFSVKAPVTSEQYGKVESIVRGWIRDRMPVSTLEVTADVARGLGNLRTLPGMVYPDKLSVVAVRSAPEVPLCQSVSLEACCGTHVDNTGRIGDLVILSQRSVSQACRSVRVATGPEAARVRQEMARFEAEVERLEGAVAEMERSSVSYSCGELHRKLGSVRQAAGDVLPLTDRKSMDDRLAAMRNRTVKLVRARAKEEVARTITRDPATRFVVHHFREEAEEEFDAIFTEVRKRLGPLPSCCFVTTPVGRLHFQCRVPKEVASATFSASEWAEAVAALLPPPTVTQQTGSVTTTVTVANAGGIDIEKLMRTVREFAAARLDRK